RDGSPKILPQCRLPLTGKGVVDMIITDLCVFVVGPEGGLTLSELHPGVTLDEVRAKTGCGFTTQRPPAWRLSPDLMTCND
ncbi:MAG: hypothetical protein PHG21_06830, partial [Azoarcus sp.]|nr:hypothetical protein [Azoarcus sp.]